RWTPRPYPNRRRNSDKWLSRFRPPFLDLRPPHLECPDASVNLLNLHHTARWRPMAHLFGGIRSCGLAAQPMTRIVGVIVGALHRMYPIAAADSNLLVHRFGPDPRTRGRWARTPPASSAAAKLTVPVYSSPLPLRLLNPGSSPAPPRVHLLVKPQSPYRKRTSAPHAPFWSGVHPRQRHPARLPAGQIHPAERRIVDYLIGRLPPQNQICSTSAEAQCKQGRSLSSIGTHPLRDSACIRRRERKPGGTSFLRILTSSSCFDRYGSEQLLKEMGVRQHFESWANICVGGTQACCQGDFNAPGCTCAAQTHDRTIMSAQANLAGLFPEQCSAAADGAAQLPACYPVPIHTLYEATDQLLKMSLPLSSLHSALAANSNCAPMVRTRPAGRRFAWLAERARVGTGWRQGEPLGISELWKIADPIAVWRSLGLKLPRLGGS
uniref:Alpha-1,6-mannosyl-glycoprotein 6-beta-N-acetylglucosaminyltransferase n=1 Tax=Macrostomum lignano TaxID=282301 RepID=A0A1I8JPD9_9PLAT